MERKITLKEQTMTIGERIAEERKKKGMTQEDMAEKLNLSRQAISKWESGSSFPDTENLLKLSFLFSVSVDYLLKGEMVEEKNGEEEKVFHLSYSSLTRMKERHSERTLWGLPLWSVGRYAKGFFALGFRSEGIFSLGFFSKGVFSLGCFTLGGISVGMASLGLLSLGAFSGGIISFGAVSLALMASVGAISISPLSIGSLSLGEVSIGAFSRGRFFAYGDDAKALVALAKTKAEGTWAELLPIPSSKAEALFLTLKDNIPSRLSWTMGIVKNLLGL